MHSKIARLVKPASFEVSTQSLPDGVSFEVIEEAITLRTGCKFRGFLQTPCLCPFSELRKPSYLVHIDSLAETIRARCDILAFRRNTRANNETMLQRDPESMKQTTFIPTAEVRLLARAEVGTARMNLFGSLLKSKLFSHTTFVHRFVLLQSPGREITQSIRIVDRC